LAGERNAEVGWPRSEVVLSTLAMNGQNTKGRKDDEEKFAPGTSWLLLHKPFRLSMGFEFH